MQGYVQLDLLRSEMKTVWFFEKRRRTAGVKRWNVGQTTIFNPTFADFAGKSVRDPFCLFLDRVETRVR